MLLHRKNTFLKVQRWSRNKIDLWTNPFWFSMADVQCKRIRFRSHYPHMEGHVRDRQVHNVKEKRKRKTTQKNPCMPNYVNVLSALFTSQQFARAYYYKHIYYNENLYTAATHMNCVCVECNSIFKYLSPFFFLSVVMQRKIGYSVRISVLL